MSTTNHTTAPTYAALVRVLTSVPVVVHGDDTHDALRQAQRQAEAITGGTAFEVTELLELRRQRPDTAELAITLAYVAEHDPAGRLLAAKRLKEVIHQERAGVATQGVDHG